MARSTKSRFQRAVEATPGVSSAHEPGVQALEPRDRKLLAEGDRRLATGSVFLDGALRSAQPNANRWDYGVGLDADGRESVVWLEVHHAASKQGDLVVKKLEWLRHWLRTSAPELERMPRKFVWLLSNVETNPNDRTRRNSLAERYGLIRRQGLLRLREFL